MRQRPTGEVESFAADDDADRVDAPMSTEDVAVYAAVDDGGMADNPEFPTFEDGHRENLIAEAVARSARERRWVGVIE